uniref:Uncharacterized protein n=1 Tax=Clytia hemisphaerica TaxID=252671 RepID=A0A7M5TSS1_9CNID
MAFNNSINYTNGSKVDQRKPTVEVRGDLAVYATTLTYVEAKGYFEGLLRKIGFSVEIDERIYRCIYSLGKKLRLQIKGKSSVKRRMVKEKWHFFTPTNAGRMEPPSTPEPRDTKKLKHFADLGKRQQQRRISQIKSAMTETAEKSGLVPQEIKLLTPSRTKISLKFSGKFAVGIRRTKG